MLNNIKHNFLAAFIFFCLVFFRYSDLSAQKKSFTEEMTQRKRDMMQPKQTVSRESWKDNNTTASKENAQSFIGLNKYKYIVVTKYSDDSRVRTEKMEEVGQGIKNWLIEHGVPVISNANDALYKGAAPCEIVTLKYFVTAGMTKLLGNITAENCDFNTVVSLIYDKFPGQALLSKVFLRMFKPILEENSSYFYKYEGSDSQNKPLPVASSNPTTTQSTPIQTNTTYTNQVNVEQTKTTTKAPVVSDVDLNIPLVAKPNSNRFALIIGNEDYHSNQSGLRAEADVEFASHDAATFKEYAIKILGVPEDNMIFITNAKLVEMNRSVEKLSLLSKATGGDAEIFFYYAGHGYPDEITKEAYIIPVDVSGADLKYALKLKEIYNTLTAFQSKRVTIFMDACFSGGAREAPLLANRGIKIKPKETNLFGNEVVFCATSNDQSAMAYKAKGHGMFTYFLLKKLQETKGDVAYSELYESLQKQVGVKSILENSMEQTPTMVTAPGLGESWKEWRMR